MGEWFKWKTFWAALAAIIAAIAAYSTGDMTLMQLIAAIWAAIQTMFIRAGVAKMAKPK